MNDHRDDVQGYDAFDEFDASTTTDVPASPYITHFSWGKVRVEGYTRTFKDVQIYPGGVQEWDWNVNGTRHDPGIHPLDALPLLHAGARIIILSRGVQEMLKVQSHMVEMLEKKGFEVHALQSEAAVERYNELANAGEAVGMLLHSTC
jgi:hypothetical protein